MGGWDYQNNQGDLVHSPSNDLQVEALKKCTTESYLNYRNSITLYV